MVHLTLLALYLGFMAERVGLLKTMKKGFKHSVLNSTHTQL